MHLQLYDFSCIRKSNGNFKYIEWSYKYDALQIYKLYWIIFPSTMIATKYEFSVYQMLTEILYRNMNALTSVGFQ
jgi:hypothetical protein